MLTDRNRCALWAGEEVASPAESCVAAIEVKSSLAGAEFEKAIRKIAEVESLQRRPHHGMYGASEAQPLVQVPPAAPMGYVVGISAPTWQTLEHNLAANSAWFNDDFLTFGPEIISVLDRPGFLMKYDLLFHTPMPGVDGYIARDEQKVGLEAITWHVQETLNRYGALTY